MRLRSVAEAKDDLAVLVDAGGRELGPGLEEWA